jgi:hypothetical protein
MKLGYSSEALFKLFATSVFTNTKATRLVLALGILLIVVSSPIFMLVNPGLLAASQSTNPTNTITSPSTIGQDGSDFTTQAALSSLSARPTNNIVNTNSFYDVVFLTATAGAIKTIQVTFPAGTTIPSGAFFNEAEGIGPGTASKSGQTITYTLTNAVNVPAGTKIRLEFANINNPLNPSASYQVTVTTRNAANTPIDGPTPSTAYTMKQIGANAIANNAVTTPKISDGAITSTKPAESFMKDVSVFDNPAGNAIGWDPDGIETSFEISEPEILSFGTFISVEVRAGDNFNRNCDTVNFSLSLQTFIMTCESPPPANAVLHYVVQNLPTHLIE